MQGSAQQGTAQPKQAIKQQAALPKPKPRPAAQPQTLQGMDPEALSNSEVGAMQGLAQQQATAGAKASDYCSC